MGAKGGSPRIGTAALPESLEQGCKTITVWASDDPTSLCELCRTGRHWGTTALPPEIGFVFGVGWVSRVSQVVYFMVVVCSFEMFEIGFVFHFFIFFADRI